MESSLLEDSGMVTMNYLLINDRLWMPVNYTIPLTVGGILIDVTDSQLRPLEHWMPGVGYRPKMTDVTIDLDGRWLISEFPEWIGGTPPKPFELGVAEDDPGNIVAKFNVVVDTGSPAWDDFCNSIPTRPGEYEPPRKLPLRIFELTWHKYEDLCHS